ncbi:DUF2254 domain-containing protein [Ilumatobacter sp.]|uniref:DUF2254 domain-containing protein n=1 Tax=Ilumatobacter sp. TaxID=1967498 RepID=UPI003B519EDD
MLWWQPLVERVRQNLWFWPVLTAMASVVVAHVLATVGASWEPALDGVLVSMAPDEVRSVLATVLAALVTASSVVSSLTIVALQTASSQFSPRLLRNFVRDGTTQAVLALFVGSSGYIVTLIVQAGDETARLAVTSAFVLVLVGVIVIAYFFNHVSQSIRVESIMHSVVEETNGATQRLGTWTSTGEASRTADAAPPPHARPVVAERSGYVQQIAIHPLVSFAAEHDLVIRYVVQVGQPTTRGALVAWWWASEVEGGVPDDIDHQIADHLQIGEERTMHHDVGLGLRQLVDMSVKAMSPSINDPYTAAQAVDHLADVLVALDEIPLGDRAWRDGDVERLIIPVVSFAELASLATSQLRRYGAHEPTVLLRLVTMLRDVASAVSPEHEPILRDLVIRCSDGSGIELELDREELARARDEVLSWFDHRAPPRTSARHGL